MNFQEAHSIATIHLLLGHDERLIYFFFDHKRLAMRLGPSELLEEALGFSRGEYVLLQAAIDFWSGEGGLRLNDALGGLDDENLLNLIMAMLHHREIQFPENVEC